MTPDAVSLRAPVPVYRGPDEPIQWTFDPWREGLVRPLASALSAIALSALAFTSHLPLPAATALVIGIVALTAPGYLPADFRIDTTGVSRRIAGTAWRSMRWERVKSVSLRHGGLLVEPRSRFLLPAAVSAWALPLSARDTNSGMRERLRAWRDSGWSGHDA